MIVFIDIAKSDLSPGEELLGFRFRNKKAALAMRNGDNIDLPGTKSVQPRRASWIVQSCVRAMREICRPC